MADKTKLAVLGGSSFASPLLVEELAHREDRTPLEVCLIGRTETKLAQVAAACKAVAARAKVPISISYETDTRRGLEKTDYILNQVRVGGYAARAYDEKFPQQFGIMGEETFGPGGLSNALRTIPVVLDYCKLIEETAPQALLLNLTNPNSIIQYAAVRYSKVAIVGVCDSPVGITQSIASILGVPQVELWPQYVGMHHFGWVVKVFWKGKDVMPDLLNKLDESSGLPVDVEIARAVGGIPTSYFKFYYHSNRVLAQQQKQDKVRAEQLMELEAQVLEDYAAMKDGEMPAGLRKRGATWYGGIVVPVMLAHANDANEVYALNVVNGCCIPWLPAEAIVETPTLVTGHGFVPLEPPETPPDIQAMVRLNAAFEMLWAEAVVEKDEGKALRAMMLNHLVHDYDQAKAILKEIWKF